MDSQYDMKRFRSGKTKMDHFSGAWAKRLQNQSIRGQWSQSLEKGGSGRHTEPFPFHTMNGHRYYRGGCDTRHERKQMFEKMAAR